MRTQLIAAAVLGLLAIPAVGLGQGPTGVMTVVTDVDVRCGASTKFYQTSRLRRGDAVFVVGEVKDQPGWLAIKPPTGSFSWINGKHAKVKEERAGGLGYVEASDSSPVPVLPGSSVVNQEPNVESLKLKTGTIIELVDRPMEVAGQTWFPIKPHPSEVRYIPAEAVRTAAQVAGTGPPNWTLSNNVYATNPLIAEAEQAAKTGDFGRARQLLQQAADRSGDQNQKVYALNRLASLPTAHTPPGHPAHMTSNPGVRPAANTATTSFSPSTPPAPAALGAGPQWSTYGILQRTSFEIDGQPVYALVNSQGGLLTHVTTRPGLTLRDYLGRTVSVYGPVQYRSDSNHRYQYVVASHVALP